MLEGVGVLIGNVVGKAATKGVVSFDGTTRAKMGTKTGARIAVGHRDRRQQAVVWSKTSAPETIT